MTSFRKKSLIAAILALSLFISGCRQQTGNENGVDITDPAADFPDINNSMNISNTGINTELFAGSAVTIELYSRSIKCNGVYAENIINCLNEQQTADPSEYALLRQNEYSDLWLYPDLQWQVSVSGGGTSIDYTRCLSDKGYIIIDDFMNFYLDSSDLSKAVIEGIVADGSELTDLTDNSYDNDTAYYTIDYPEPNTEEEYRKAAIACTDAWLTSLQSADTEDFYRNKGFTITEADDWGRTKCNYLSCGMVNGRKEFVAEICFTAEDCGDNTFYDKYYQEGRYTAAGTYWRGNYICGRFNWENGKCSLLDITTRDGCDRLQQGLNGISDSGYKTFFDFARRPDLQEAINNSFVPKGWTVSANLTQTEDGKPINIDIYASGGEYYEETENTITAIWDERAYINGKSTYSTGLYFTDGGTGHMPDTLPKDFHLTFDNYDGDANPDFCVRYDDDENGTFYVLESVQTDGRIFNLSGRAFEGGIYIAGCTNPSPRLQKTDDIPYVGWKAENGRYYPTDENGDETELPDLNMYSDRLYLPDSLKFYSQDENLVTCFLWNNTASPVITDSSYSIEYFENGQWKKAAESLTTKAVTINPREHAEITYDISALKTRYNTYYRIVQQCGDLTTYGRFCLEGEKVSNVQYETKDVILGQSIAEFAVIDSGIFDGISSAPLISKNILVKDGTAEYPLTLLNSLTDFFSDDTITYYYSALDLPQKTGEYTLVIDGSEVCTVKVKEPENRLGKYPELSVKAEIAEDTAVLTLSSDTAAEITDIFVYINQDGYWELSPLFCNADYPLSLETDEPLTVELINVYETISDEDYELFLEIAGDEELYNETFYEEIGITPDMDFESFKKAMKEYFSIGEDDDYLAVIGFCGSGEEDCYQKYFRF